MRRNQAFYQSTTSLSPPKRNNLTVIPEQCQEKKQRMNLTYRSISGFEMKIADAKTRNNTICDKTQEEKTKKLQMFPNPGDIEKHVERVYYNSQSKLSNRKGSCDGCITGVREHTHPFDKPFSSTLFKIKPISTKHRLLRKKGKPSEFASLASQKQSAAMTRTCSALTFSSTQKNNRLMASTATRFNQGGSKLSTDRYRHNSVSPDI